ncbi:MAG: hypothetical protein EOP34_05625 [Rickettsiales bacterium]|nr:MAG: hypothetical protein EOP34_05625 [Rickettsiales bacterium]
MVAVVPIDIKTAGRLNTTEKEDNPWEDTMTAAQTESTYWNTTTCSKEKGIGIFGGLFHTTATTNTFHIFIFLITSVILLLTSFYPRKSTKISISDSKEDEDRESKKSRDKELRHYRKAAYKFDSLQKPVTTPF